MTGAEFRQLRKNLSEALGRELSMADMAKLCGLPAAGGPVSVRRWEVTGPSEPVAKLLAVLAMASDRHPILDEFNVFDRYDVPVSDRPARKQAFREKMRDDVRRRLG